MYNIAFFHNVLGRTDGVSLEIDKWKRVLTDMGHRVFYCAGNDDLPGVYCIPELSFTHPLTNKILRNGTVKLTDYSREEELKEDILYQAGVIKSKALDFINRYNIDLLIPNNLLSVGYNIPAVLALSEIIQETGLPTINHNHDFYFEDSGEVNPTCETVRKMLDSYIPPAGENVQNLVINKLARQELLERKGVEARVVPNVFDFQQPRWVKDEFNRDFREAVGVGENDLLFLQATRILDRKGVELAVDLIAELEKPGNRRWLYGKLYDGREFTPGDRIVLVCSGYVEEFGISGNYYQNLLQRAEKQGVEIKFVGEMVKHSRGRSGGEKIYSLWDSYVHADFVTYPSLWEGWGNQLIEALFACQPVVIFEYPVYQSDLKGDGFKMVSLGETTSDRDENGLVQISPERIKQAVGEVIYYLKNKQAREEMTVHNFQTARENYSFASLQGIIAELLQNLSKTRV